MSCKVQQSVRSNCVTYEKGRIYFNYFNTFYNVTREEAKELLPIIKAFAEGKSVQFSDEGNWYKTENPAFASGTMYRIKPESRYRPFKSQEECWNEMLKHQPFGWVKEISSEMLYLINGISNESIVIMEDINSFKEAMNIYEFKDGTPFGIKEE